MQSSLGNGQIHNGEVSWQTVWEAVGQEVRQMEIQIDFTRQTKRQIDTDRQKNRWMEQVDRQTNRRINLNC